MPQPKTAPGPTRAPVALVIQRSGDTEPVFVDLRNVDPRNGPRCRPSGLGPALAPISKIRRRTRWQILIKGPSAGAFSPVAEAVERTARALKGNVRANLDVDPLAML